MASPNPTIPSAWDFATGEALHQQVDDETNERRKKLMRNAQVAGTGLTAASLLGLAGTNGAAGGMQ